MSPLLRSLIIKWIGGAVVGTLIIAATSPLFVRSYLPLQGDQVRGVWVLSEHSVYRWRREGYANTYVGPYGMPGRQNVNVRQPAEIRVALWGDSQAEGVAVHDSQKLFAQTEEQADRHDYDLTMLPLTRSGEDASHWLTQFASVEEHFDIDAHVVLISGLSDLQKCASSPLNPPSADDVANANSAIAKRLPAFVIQGARYLLTESDDVTRRKLRFSLGKAKRPNAASNQSASIETLIDWKPQVDALLKRSNWPVIVVYAPQLPSIIDGQVRMEDPNGKSFLAFKQIAESSGVVVLDVREQMKQSVQSGEWPHGFHNGRFGNGHLNATGYRIIAEQLAPVIRQVVRKAD